METFVEIVFVKFELCNPKSNYPVYIISMPHFVSEKMLDSMINAGYFKEDDTDSFWVEYSCLKNIQTFLLKSVIKTQDAYFIEYQNGTIHIQKIEQPSTKLLTFNPERPTWIEIIS